MLPSLIRSASGGRIRRPSPAFVIALAALFVALSGTGLASNSSTRPITGINDILRVKFVTLPAAQLTPFEMKCPKGDFAINGAFDTGANEPIVKSAAAQQFSDWDFAFVNLSDRAYDAQIGIDCLKLDH